MKNYRTWLKTAAVFQLINAVLHAITLFVSLPPKNATEKQLIDLMDSYKFDLGAGFHRTMGDLLFALSACFTLVCLLGGLLNWFLLSKKASPEIMKGVININLIVFGICLIIVAMFAFLEPIIMVALIVLFLLLARVLVSKSK